MEKLGRFIKKSFSFALARGGFDPCLKYYVKYFYILRHFACFFRLISSFLHLNLIFFRETVHFFLFEMNFALASACVSSGNSTALEMEITQQIMYNKTAWKVIKQTDGPTDGSGAHKKGIMVEVTADYPLVSLMSMLVPSPDWFVGISGVSLCNAGMWRDYLNITSLQPWDAGTEDGNMFAVNNSETSPPENITIITKDTPGTPFMGANDIATLGTLMFKRINKPAEYTCSGEQKYELKFEGTWSDARQPVTTFPANAHFSKLIGCTHKYNYKFWSPMTMASQGVQEVAESGKLRTLMNSFNMTCILFKMSSVGLSL